MAGRRQPERFATPADWRMLVDHAGAYWRAGPWRRWAQRRRLDRTSVHRLILGIAAVVAHDPQRTGRTTGTLTLAVLEVGL